MRPTGRDAAPFWEWFDPAEVTDPPLYQRFAALSAEDDFEAALEDFTSCYGRILRAFEPLSPHTEAREMAAMIRLHAAIESARSADLAEFIVWRKRAAVGRFLGAVHFLNAWPSPLDETCQSAGWPEHPQRTFRRGDLLAPARLLFIERLNRKLEGAVATRYLPNGQTMEAAKLAACPRDLLAFMWLQFAQAAGGAATFRTCAAPGCEVIFTPAQRNRRTCSDACRQRLKYHSDRTENRGA